MKNYVQPGETITLTAPSTLASGGGFMVGSIFAVATADAANGANIEGITRGVFDLAKATGQVWAAGAKLYWDNTAKNVTTVAGGNTQIAVATQAAASADAIGRAKLGYVA